MNRLMPQLKLPGVMNSSPVTSPSISMDKLDTLKLKGPEAPPPIKPVKIDTAPKLAGVRNMEPLEKIAHLICRRYAQEKQANIFAQGARAVGSGIMNAGRGVRGMVQSSTPLVRGAFDSARTLGGQGVGSSAVRAGQVGVKGLGDAFSALPAAQQQAMKHVGLGLGGAGLAAGGYGAYQGLKPEPTLMDKLKGMF